MSDRIRALPFDPTPAGLITNKSLRRAFKSEWARIRAAHFRDGGLGCDICGAAETTRSLIHAHEAYSFPNPRTVRLDRIVFICTRCHDAIHLERSMVRCRSEYVATLKAHYCQINRVTMGDLERDLTKSRLRGIEIREFYGGASASPDLDYGPYQDAADRCLSRKRGPREPDDDDDDFNMYPDHECPWDIGHAN